MEITECTSSEVDSNDFQIDIPRNALKGLGEVNDRLEYSPPKNEAPKPTIFKRVFITVALIFLHISTMSIQLFNWILKRFFGYESRQKLLYRELHLISKTQKLDEIHQFLLAHSQHKFPAGYLFREFLHLPEIHSELAKILEGANISLKNDKGFFCRRWSEYSESYRRISSHNYQGEECYAIGHFLFWLDLNGNTRFQFENSPLKGFFSSINHLFDYLYYRRDNEQQGVSGSSLHTEDYCLEIEVDPLQYMLRELNQTRLEP